MLNFLRLVHFFVFFLMFSISSCAFANAVSMGRFTEEGFIETYNYYALQQRMENVLEPYCLYDGINDPTLGSKQMCMYDFLGAPTANTVFRRNDCSVYRIALFTDENGIVTRINAGSEFKLNMLNKHSLLELNNISYIFNILHILQVKDNSISRFKNLFYHDVMTFVRSSELQIDKTYKFKQEDPTKTLFFVFTLTKKNDSLDLLSGFMVVEDNENLVF